MPVAVDAEEVRVDVDDGARGDAHGRSVAARPGGREENGSGGLPSTGTLRGMAGPTRCSHCAGPVDAGARWCPKCGAVVSWHTPTAEAAIPPAAYLLVQSPGGRVRKTPLSTAVVRVGRAPSCEVIVKHPRVSRIHATLELKDGAYHLADAKSSGGTFLEGRPVHAKAVRVAAGATIRLGRNEEDSVTLVYHEEEPDSIPVDPAAPPAAAPPDFPPPARS